MTSTDNPGGSPDSPADPENSPLPEAEPGPDAEPSSEPSAEQATDSLSQAPSDRVFPIVGIGASAGGLSAFEAFFSAIPREIETGMAFVLVQHLSPDHKSILAELVKRYTRMRVQEVEDGMVVEPDRAYIIPPSLDMALFKGKLHLLEPQAPHGLRLPIDFFFRSLALDQHERAICVVLSGTGSDGTLGARAVKGEGGMVMAQAPKTAAYDGMPRSVIATGLADFVLPPNEMPAQIMAYAAHAFGRGAPLLTPTRSEDALTKICILLRDKTSHDFSQYKQSTLVRRIERRMALHQLDRQGDYVRYLQQDAEEIEALFHDLLIGVTNFFRDPEAFAVLEQDVIPRLFIGKPAGSTVRIWVCGCSTGEEAYSIAILLQEHMETLKKSFRLQVFATDVDSRAIEKARTGVYPLSIAAEVSPERLARYFSREADGEGYRIQKGVRDLLVFSEQDLIKDPPFSRLDLISCRNLLIYLNGGLQRKLIPLFHYALNPQGLLFLGNSETIGEALTLFSPLNRKWKIYIRREQLTHQPASSLSLGDFLPRASSAEPAALNAREPRTGKLDPRGLTEQALLLHYDPVALLTTARGDILYIIGRTGRYLELPTGEAAMNILDMAREGLNRTLSMALHRAVATKEVTQLQAPRIRTNGDTIGVNLTIRPVGSKTPGELAADLYLVVFEPVPALETKTSADTETETPPGSARDAHVSELESELRAKEEYLQTTLEEMETANEELKSTNEEMQSVNEELQSTNEELETSKEELQSVNEELATVNAELQTKVSDLSRANNDMNNLLAGTGVATLFVDYELRITRFTPTATQLIKLIQSDIGRSVGDIVSNLVNYTGFIEDVRTVLKTLVPHEQEVQTLEGAWYLMRIGPYRTLENVIEGAVITFVDISNHKRVEADLRAARILAEGIVNAVRDPLVVLNEELRVISANRAFHRYFHLSHGEVQGQPLFELAEGKWDTQTLRQRLLEVQSQGASFDDLSPGQDVAGPGQRALRLNARRLTPVEGHPNLILLAFEDRDEPSLLPPPESDHDQPD